MRDWLASRADATPVATALAAAGDVETAVTYAELDERVEERAGRLAARGVLVDDRLAICAGTRQEFVDLVYAAQRLGAVLVPVDPRRPAGPLSRRLERVGPAAVVCEATTETTVCEAVAEDEKPVLTLDDPVADAEGLSAVRPEPFNLPEWELDDPMDVLFTSGTTGDPKAVVLTVGNVLASATASAFRLGLRADDCWHVTLPTHHMGGLAPIYRSVLYGTALSIQRRNEGRARDEPERDRQERDGQERDGQERDEPARDGGERGFDPEATIAALRAADATAVSLVPTMLERLLDATADAHDRGSDGGDVDVLSGLRFVLLGGAPARVDLLRRAQERGVQVAPTYGATEAASQVATAQPAEARERPESVGSPVMFADVTVVDDAGGVCEPGESGELVVSGPMVTPGYLDREVTAEAFSTGGLRTGDRGFRDEAGRVYVEGRVDDTILTGGETVDPTTVAEALRAHGAVHDCAVVGLPDESWGERVGALVVPTAGASVTIETLREHCREHLADHELPRGVAFVDELPRTASGTVDRDAVRAAIRARTHTANGENGERGGSG